MRPIARQSARLANCQRLRAASRPRSPVVQQRRAFQAGASRLSESTPPNGSPEHYRALEEQREKERKAADEALRQERNGIEGSAEVKKGGRTRGATHKKHGEVPSPPPLPEWFLKHNVLLVPEETNRDGSGARQLRCVEAQTGHTLFHVPYYPEEAQEEKAKNDQEEAAKKEQEEQAKRASIPGINMIGNDFFQQKFGGQIPPVLEGENDLPLGFKIPSSTETLNIDPLSWTLLETEASIRATFESGASTSHAATKSDLVLHCPDWNSHDQMDQYVRDIAQVLRADLIRLDANDIADLTAEYVGENSDSPGSFSTLGYNVYDGAAANGLGIRGARPGEHADPEEFEQEDEDEDVDPQSSMNLGHFGTFDELRKALGDKRHDINKALGNFGIAGVSVGLPQGGNPFAPPTPVAAPSKRTDASDYVSWDDARLVALLKGVVDAPSKAKDAGLTPPEQVATDYATSVQGLHGEDSLPWSGCAGSMVGDIAKTMKRRINSSTTPAPAPDAKDSPAIKLEDDQSAHQKIANSERRRTIVHIRDLKPILGNRLGESIVQRLVRVVRRRRRAGEEVIVIGTSAEDVSGPLDGLLDAYEDSPFRLIVVPPLFGMSATERHVYQSSALPVPTQSIYQAPSYDRIANINLRHITSMMNRLGHRTLGTSTMEASFKQLYMPGTHILSEKVLPQEQVQRLVLTAIGLSKTHAQADEITPIHVALATAILARADHTVHSWTSFRDDQQFGKAGKGIPFGKNAPGSGSGASEQNPGQARIEKIKKDCNQHETRLLAGVVDPQNIKTGFNDVHATPESIEALKSMTTLSLMRPDAFQYGVLANDRLTGLLLYGPPGTGKTLLAKAVAKDSGATVLEVSGAQIYEKYVGEGEKMVRAVFSLAKKLSPCVVFIDEADAIFGSRGGSGNRNTHREIINQFLREWDGMDNNSVFMMVASNRPFDLDDAVMRRLPRRLLVDLPIAKDRESILGIHLRHESLDSSVNLATLSEQTPLYSGSDLKNVCVSAALAAVREENEVAEKHKDDKDFKLPEKRTLTSAHFEKAIAEISASINEDMSSLTAIKKFDEQFGDRRGRKKKSGYGFGTGTEEVDESSARVRSGP